jgi:hypothetical protein
VRSCAARANIATHCKLQGKHPAHIHARSALADSCIHTHTHTPTARRQYLQFQLAQFCSSHGVGAGLADSRASGKLPHQPPLVATGVLTLRIWRHTADLRAFDFGSSMVQRNIDCSRALLSVHQQQHARTVHVSHTCSAGCMQTHSVSG